MDDGEVVSVPADLKELVALQPDAPEGIELYAWLPVFRSAANEVKVRALPELPDESDRWQADTIPLAAGSPTILIRSRMVLDMNGEDWRIGWNDEHRIAIAWIL